MILAFHSQVQRDVNFVENLMKSQESEVSKSHGCLRVINTYTLPVDFAVNLELPWAWSPEFTLKLDHLWWFYIIIWVLFGFSKTDSPEVQSTPQPHQSPRSLIPRPHLPKLRPSSCVGVSEKPPNIPPPKMESHRFRLKEPMQTLSSLLIEHRQLTFGHCIIMKGKQWSLLITFGLEINCSEIVLLPMCLLLSLSEYLEL